MSNADHLFDGTPDLFRVQTKAAGPRGALPLTKEMLLQRPSGDLFGLSQDAGMGWTPSELGRKQFLILSTLGGLRAPDGKPIALGYHIGHWEIGLLVQAAAYEFRSLGTIPFAGFCSDPCDGRSQGTPAMFDSLPYRNDAAQVFRRLIRSLPNRAGVLGIATCDKGLPATMMALAAMRDLPTVLVPGGVTLPPENGEDAGTIQTVGARFAHGLISLQDAADLGCRACASPGGGCQFLGTAATSQVVAEALGMALPHSALVPSGQPVWTHLAVRSARALVQLGEKDIRGRHTLTADSIHNAMAVHAAFGGSTNLLLHVPAIAHAAGLPRPIVADWIAINRQVPRLVDVLPNGPTNYPTVSVFLAGGVPEVMLHLRELGLLRTGVLTVSAHPLDAVLDAWSASEWRRRFRERLFTNDGVDPDNVIMPPARAQQRRLPKTMMFPQGNLAPEGAVIKSTAIDPAVLDPDGCFRKQGSVQVFVSEKAAMAAIKTGRIQPGAIMALIGCGPMGTGMEETYQLTSALKHVPFGKQVALLTDARFSGVSTGVCIGHIGPEALAGGPLGRLRDGDLVRILLDPVNLVGTMDFVGDATHTYSPLEAAAILARRPLHPELHAAEGLPDDTRLWARLQQVSGGTWGGCVFDAASILAALDR